MTAALELSGVHKSFDGNLALVDAFFTAEWGEVHALLGENGAGKSTLMNVACGLYAPDEGVVKVAGDAVTIESPVAAQALGIGMVHQHFKLVHSMTVLENIILGHGKGSFRQSRRRIRREIEEIGSQVGFEVDPDAPIDSLSVSEQQRVEIVKALVGGANILILDEPTAVLTDAESERLLDRLRVFAAAGTCVVIITHKLREVFSHADKVTVMRGGQTVDAGRSPSDLTLEKLSRLMVGAAREFEATEAFAVGSEILALEGIEARRENGASALQGLSMHVRSGEVYGLAGVGGNGQTELAEILMGVRSIDAGSIRVDGSDLSKTNPRALRQLGLACIPAERYIYGLAGDLSVMENFVITHLDNGTFGSAAWINRRAVRRETERVIESFEIHGAVPATNARLLSGGNAQKLVLAREMTGESRVLLAHSPTRGLDVRACAAVHQALRDACRRGAAVLLLSEDLDEVLAVSDRIGVINNGRIVGEFERPGDRAEIGRLMVGHA
jgi:simple sugar transport system ATP-binding protein